MAGLSQEGQPAITRSRSVSRLGDVLVERGIITPNQLTEACAFQKTHGGRVGRCLVKLGFASEEDIASALSEQYGIRPVNLIEIIPDKDALDLIPRETAIRYETIPIRRHGNSLIVALADPLFVQTLDELRFITGLTIEPRICIESQIPWAIEQYYGTGQEIEAREMLKSIGQPAASDAESNCTRPDSRL